MLIDLFINCCILVALLFVYLQFKWHKLQSVFSNKSNLIIDGLALGALSNILMYFSIHVNAETIVDLRHVPVIIALIFLGKYPAMISALLVILGRFLYGINISSFAALVFMVMFMIGAFIIHSKRYQFTHFRQGLYMLLYSNVIFSVIIISVLQNWFILKSLLPLYWVLSFIGGSLAIYIVTYLKNSHESFYTYQKQSSQDYLTGLNNVRGFDQFFQRTVENAEKRNESLSIFMIDIDHFKKVNDTYGHQAGDLVLKQLGDLLRESTRSFDFVSRNGGEEFSVILQDCPKVRALEIAERVRVNVQKKNFTLNDHDDIKITVSIGVSTYPTSVSNISEILEDADRSLYHAKNSGRNRIVSA